MMDWTGLNDFWQLVVTVWQDGVLGIDIGQLVTALGILLGFLIIRNLFTRFVIKQVRFVVRRTRTAIDDKILEAIEQPIRFVPAVMGVFFASSYLEPTGALATFFANLNTSLVTFTIFWALYRAVTPVGGLLEHAGGFLTDAMVSWIVKAAKAGFFLLGAAAILETWGVHVAPLIAGLGLFGVALALGAQDLFKNLIAGLFIIGERRFHRGDWILVDGVVEGTVEYIGFRTTEIRRFDKALVYVPNSKLSDNAVTNFSRMTHRRIKWLIGLEYRTTAAQLQQIRDGIETFIVEDPAFAKPDEVSTFVRIDSFAASSIDVFLYCFTRTTNWGEWLAVKERLALNIKQIVEDAGAGFAFPSQSVYVEALPDAPEPFPAPTPEPKRTAPV